MDRKGELLRQEEEGWRELCALIEPLTPEQLEEPGYTPDGWSVKDLMWHVGAWSADCARVLERMRMGTWEDEPEPDTDAQNREWFEISRTLDLPTVKVEWVSARNRMLREFAALTEISRDADEWFDETGPIHYRKHADDLREWVAALTSRGAT